MRLSVLITSLLAMGLVSSDLSAACMDGQHSVKMAGETCEFMLCEEVYTLDLITEISTKDGPSAIYRKSGDCYDPVESVGPYNGDYVLRCNP